MIGAAGSSEVKLRWGVVLSVTLYILEVSSCFKDRCTAGFAEGGIVEGTGPWLQVCIYRGDSADGNECLGRDYRGLESSSENDDDDCTWSENVMSLLGAWSKFAGSLMTQPSSLDDLEHLTLMYMCTFVSNKTDLSPLDVMFCAYFDLLISPFKKSFGSWSLELLGYSLVRKQAVLIHHTIKLRSIRWSVLNI